MWTAPRVVLQSSAQGGAWRSESSRIDTSGKALSRPAARPRRRAQLHRRKPRDGRSQWTRAAGSSLPRRLSWYGACPGRAGPPASASDGMSSSRGEDIGRPHRDHSEGRPGADQALCHMMNHPITSHGDHDVDAVFGRGPCPILGLRRRPGPDGGDIRPTAQHGHDVAMGATGELGGCRVGNYHYPVHRRPRVPRLASSTRERH